MCAVRDWWRCSRWIVWGRGEKWLKNFFCSPSAHTTPYTSHTTHTYPFFFARKLTLAFCLFHSPFAPSSSSSASCVFLVILSLLAVIVAALALSTNDALPWRIFFSSARFLSVFCARAMLMMLGDDDREWGVRGKKKAKSKVFTYENKYTSSLAWGGWVRAAVVCWSSTSPSLFDDGEPNEKREKNFFFASRFFPSSCYFALFFWWRRDKSEAEKPSGDFILLVLIFNGRYTRHNTARAGGIFASFLFFGVCFFIDRTWMVWHLAEMEKMNLFFRYLTRPHSLLLLKLHIYDAREIVSFLTGRERKVAKEQRWWRWIEPNACLLRNGWLNFYREHPHLSTMGTLSVSLSSPRRRRRFWCCHLISSYCR